MGHGHAHGPAPELDPVRRRRVRTILWVMLVPLFLATLVGLIALWPGGGNPTAPIDDPTNIGQGSSFDTVIVSKVEQRACLPSDPDPSAASCTGYTADTGAQIYIPPEALRTGIEEGDRIKVLDIAQVAQAQGVDDGYSLIFVDFDRDLPLGILAGIYALVVIVVAGFRGFRALIGLVYAYCVLLFFMLPALVQGKDPLLVTMTASSAIMIVVLYLAHGVSARTSAALLGTFGGIAVTLFLGGVAVDFAHITITGTEAGMAISNNTSLQLGTITVASMIVAGLGVLNDVTITQASAVWELAAGKPRARGVELYRSAMRIGRDHIASTVYTIAFAIVGGALPSLMLIMLYRQGNVLESLTMGELSEEAARTLVGSIGLVLAIPLTTVISAWLVRSLGLGGRGAADGAEPRGDGGHDEYDEHDHDHDEHGHDHDGHGHGGHDHDERDPDPGEGDDRRGGLRPRGRRRALHTRAAGDDPGPGR